MGGVRLPLAGPYRPWAWLVRFPDGRLLWRVRLREDGVVVPHLVGTDVLRRFARQNRLKEIEAAIEALVRSAGPRGSD